MIRSTNLKLCKLTFAALCLFLAGGAFGALPHDPKLTKYVNDALDIMEQRSVYRNVMYWQEFREIIFEEIDELTELSDAHAVIAETLLKLGDLHGGIYYPDFVNAMRNDGVSSSILPAWTPVTAKLIGDRIGFITVPGIWGLSEQRMTRYVDEMHDMTKSIDSDDVCGWIVDLRDNTGGNVMPMLAGIGPILGTGEAGGGIRPNWTTFTRRVENGRSGSAEGSGRPYRLKNRYPPVAVLIGSETAGSGEATALAFIGRELSMTFGEPTTGLTTGMRAFNLEDGSALVLSTNLMTDRIGRSYIGSIRPHVTATENEIIDVATEWLRLSDPCQ